MKLIVNQSSRLAKARAHTATHLLHAELDRLLGGTRQAGSLVDEDYLRLDFTTSKPLTNEQILELEKKVNNYIYQALPVEKVEMSFQQAKKLGAKAFFEEKYGNIVRVVMVRGSCGNDGNDFVSIELCGGTHLDNTSGIGAFKIIGQEAVASGIRRLIAITGPKVAEKFIEQERLLQKLALELNCSVKQIEDKLSKLKKENVQLKDSYKNLQQKLFLDNIKQLFKNAKKSEIFDAIVIFPTNDIFENINFKEIGSIAKSLYGNINFLLYNEKGNFFAYTGRQDIDLKTWLKEKGLKGGGNQFQVQGKDEKILRLFTS